MALTNKQLAFVEHYLQCWNATEAAKKAGYSEKTAYSIGSENLKKPEIADYVRARIDETMMQTDELLIRMADIARGDMGDFIDDNTLSINIMRARERGKMHLIKKVKYITHVEDDSQTDTVEFELYDRLKALELIGKARKLFVDRTEHTGVDGKPIEAQITVLSELSDDDLDKIISGKPPTSEGREGTPTLTD